VESWREQYDARRSLVLFLNEQNRPEEALLLTVQNLLDAKEYARQKNRPDADAALLLADANSAIGAMRFLSKYDGGEEPMRVALAYYYRLANLEPEKAEYQNKIGVVHRELGDMQKARQDQETAAPEDYQLALLACREALRLANSISKEQRDEAKSCLSKLALLGYE
jgi:hypothetical protein